MGAAIPLPDRTLAINVRRTGAIGNGTTDDTAAIQRAVDIANSRGGGAVYVPATSAYYRLSLPIVMRDRVIIFGDGDGSYLYNDREPGTGEAFSTLVFNAGCWARQDLALFDKLDCDSSSEGDNFLVLSDADDAALLEVGEVCWTYNDDSIDPPDAPQVPTFIEMNRVVAINSETGKVTFQYPIKAAMSSPAIGSYPSDIAAIPAGSPRFIWQNGTIQNLAVGCRDAAWIQRVGAYECRIDNILVRRGEQLFSGNAFCHCIISNIRGTFSRSAFSVAIGSCDTLIQGVVGAHDANQPTIISGVNPSFGTICNIHEHCRDITCEDIQINFGNDETYGKTGACIKLDGSDLVFRNSKFFVRAGTPFAVRLENHPTDYATAVVENNIVENCIFNIAGGSSSVRVVGGEANTRNNVIQNCRFLGTQRARSIAVGSGDNLTVRDCFFESGTIELESGSTNTTVDSCEFGVAITIDDNATGSRFRRLRFPNTYKFEQLRLNDDVGTALTGTTDLREDYEITLPRTDFASETTTRIVMEYTGAFVGTADEKSVSFYFNNNPRATYTQTSAGPWKIRATTDLINNPGDNQQRILVEFWSGSSYQSNVVDFSLGYLEGNFVFAFGLQLANSADSIVPYNFTRNVYIARQIE